MEKKYNQSEEEVINSLLWPGNPFSLGAEVDFSQRYTAVLEVLRRMPQSDFVILEELVETFFWFIPETGYLAKIFPAPLCRQKVYENQLIRLEYSKVLYLSPLLENHAADIIIATVAHELAHVYLDHPIVGKAELEKINEKQADDQAIKWGFEKEIKKIHRLFKWDKKRLLIE